MVSEFGALAAGLGGGGLYGFHGISLQTVHAERRNGHYEVNHTKSGLFEVRSLYRLLRGSNNTKFPGKNVWKTKIPSKVAFFMWLAAHDKNLTIDNLRRRQLYVVEWCFMCKRGSETGEHLFLHSDYVWELWSLIFSMFGIQWTMPRTISNLLACWKRRGLTKDNNTIWNAIPGCLMWLIWRERN